MILSQGCSAAPQDVHAGTSLAAFHHEPLPDSSTDIRLLKLKADVGSNDMIFELHAWPLGQTPEYHAISYTWGELSCQTIEVNGQTLRIRHNCYQALQQATRYSPGIYLWIDSVCIDQNNVLEKSQQVQKMYQIFKNAARVLACVGGHTDDSDQLQRYCELILDPDCCATNVASSRPQDLNIPELALSFATASSRDTVAHLRSTVNAFANRPYWNRLWIVQEILAGAQSVLILYGQETSIPWWQLVSLVEMTLLLTPSSSAKDHHIASTPLRRLILTQENCELYGGTVRLSQLFQWLSGTACLDPRDRVFGLVAIVDWKATNMGPIVPDYTRDAWSLAAELVRELGVEKCGEVMRMLELDDRVDEMRALVRGGSEPQ